MSLSSNNLYEFGNFRIDVREKLLLCENERISLTPKTFDLLILFLENSGKLLSKEELMEKIWTDSFVEESNLAFTVRQLRKALQDDAHSPKFIENVPRRGYRFIAKVKQIDNFKVETSFSSSDSLNSIAVLPFANMSADTENEYFCDGLAEELLNALAKIEQLKVAARTSSFFFKNKNINVTEIGNALNVKTVLEGSVRKSNNKLRITVQLINASDGFHLWSERYDREMKDIFDVQDEITFAIVDVLKVNLLGKTRTEIFKQQTDNIEAYELYLKGLYHYNKYSSQHLQQAIEYFEQAIAKEPNYASAYVWKGFCHTALWYYGYLSPDETIPQWETCAEKVLQIDSKLAEGHLSKAGLEFIRNWNWAEAERRYLQAISLSPNFSEIRWRYGLLLTTVTRFEEAVKQGKKALELDPLSLPVNLYMGFIYLSAERFDDVFRQVNKMLALTPNFYGAYHLLGRVNLAVNNYEEAVQAFQKSLSLGGSQNDLSGLGTAYGLLGKRDEALAIVRQIEEKRLSQYVPSFNLARIYFGLGDTEKGLDWLQKSIADRDGELAFLNTSIKLGALRENDFRLDRRFIELLKQIGLPITVKDQNSSFETAK